MKKKIGLTLIAVFSAFALYSQDSYSPLKPEFTTDMNFSSGIRNIDQNATVDEIPGLSSEYSADIGVKLKGSFSRASEWGVEKEDGIEWKSGIGYEAGLSVDMAKVYSAFEGTKNYNETSDTNHYSLIQPMIDWYEANASKYGLPYSPFEGQITTGSRWPTTNYGSSSGRYQFINGSTVEPASDVNWTSTVWADAELLYNDVKYYIERAINQLDTDVFSTGNISQAEYADMDDAKKNKAEMKMKAKRDFAAVASGRGTSKSIKDAVTSGYVSITNIGGVLDARIDFLGKRLTAGEKLFSYLAGQSTSGSALTLSMKKGFVPGLEASLFTGIAGGKKQEAENFDTDALDYWRGIDGEWSAGGKARYTTYFENLGGTLQAQVQGIWSDILVADKNFAVDAGVSYKADGFVNYGAGVEAMFLNWKDREDANSDYRTAYSGLANANVGAFGAEIDLLAQYKTSAFEHRIWTSEDRFYGYSLDSDYYIANAKPAAKLRGTLKFNPQYFVNYDFIDISAGYEAFIYGENFSFDGQGIFGKVSVGIEDFTTIPLTLYGGMNYYKNKNLPVWADYENLPAQNFLDFTKISAGISFSPARYFELSAEYTSNPSYSRRNAERISSFTLNGTLKF